MASTSWGSSGGSPSNNMADKFKAMADTVSTENNAFRKLYESIGEFRKQLRENLNIRSQLEPTWDREAAPAGREINYKDLYPDQGSQFPVGIAKKKGGAWTAFWVDMKDIVRTTDQIFHGEYFPNKTEMPTYFVGQKHDAEASAARSEYPNTAKSKLEWAYTTPVSKLAAFWVVAESDRHGKTTFTIRPRRSMCEDNFGTSDQRNLFPKKSGLFSGRHDFWSYYGLPLIGEDGFRRETYTSDDGTVPGELVDDFLKFYKAGVDKGLLNTPAQQAPTYRRGGGGCKI